MSAYTFRPYVHDDIPFIGSSWGKSFYNASYYADHFRPRIFLKHHRAMRDRVFERDNLAMIVCAASEEPDQILGWVAIEVMPENVGTILHYVYVKELYRREGLAKELISRAIPNKNPVYFTHETRAGLKLIKDDYHYAPHLS